MIEPRRTRARHLSSQLIFWYSVAFLLLIAFFGFFVRSLVSDALVDQLAGSMTAEAQTVAVALDRGEPQEMVSAFADALDARVTVIALDGTVVADSAEDPAAMDNHADRPEVVEALAGNVGRARRGSATLGDSRLYVAIPPSSGLIVRISVTEDQIDARLAAMQGAIGLAALAVGLIGFGIVYVVGRRLGRPLADLAEIAGDVADGSLEVTVRRSSVSEVDRLGVAIGRMATELGGRLELADEQRRQLDDILGALPIGVLLVGQGDEIIYANATSRAVLGSVPSTLSKLVPPSLRRSVTDSRGGQAVPLEFEVGAPSRRVRALSTSLERGRVLVVIEDVTERRRVEAMRRDFVADASHELKTPVAAVLASTEALQLALEHQSSRAGEFAAHVHQSAVQLARIVEDLLDLSRLEAAERSTEVVDLDRVAREEVERLRETADNRGIVLSCQTDPAVVTGSRADLALAIRNLCDNALRYTDRGGAVSVTVRLEGGTVVVEVRDSGSGIPTRALPRVFERFYRVDVARSRATGGTGLGLAIVKHVAEAHGGSVSVESELGVGSTFRLEFPATAEVPVDNG
jgi:two-component system phosphate regulon sensor histidine kinase PhoR